MHVRRCPECGSDYRPEIETCADCGVPLEDRDDELDDDASAGSPDGDEPDAVPQGFESVFTASSVHDLTPLADLLIASGIACRLREMRRAGQVAGYRLFVPADDRSNAARAVSALMAEGSGAALDEEVQEHVDAAAGRYQRCPACGAELGGAAACPECGLQLASPEATCPECGQARGEEACTRCGNCGHVFDAGD